MDSTKKIIQVYVNSVENFLNEELYNILNISNFCKDKAHCTFKYPDSIIISNNLKLKFYEFNLFEINFNNLVFIVSKDKSEFIFTKYESDIDKIFLNLSQTKENPLKSEVFKGIGRLFEKYVNNYIDFVEANISIIVADKIKTLNENKLKNISYFKPPKFLIKKKDESKTTFIYKRGEGYSEYTKGIHTYKLVKNSILSQEEENTILTILEKKKQNYIYSENGYSFQGNNKSYENSSETLDISLTRFLLNFNSKIIHDSEFEKSFEKKFEKLSKKHLYLLTFILHCDLNDYFESIKSNFSKSDDYFLIKFYYNTLYFINQMLYDIDIDDDDLFLQKDFDDFVNYQIQNFEYIMEKVKFIFNDEIENYFDLFLVNLNKPKIEIQTLFSSLDDFLRTQKIES